MNNELVSLLFKTNAFKICEENKPFWYTSGKIGPYFVNTQFLYGSEDDANSLLNFIDKELAETEKTDIPGHLFEKVYEQYENNEIYKAVIDTLKDYISTNIDTNYINYVSGGERRDWYFSIMIAYLLGKPHITIYKDLTTVVSTCDFEESTEVTKLEGQRVLHIADLLNQASSFERAWIPAIRNLGSDIFWSAVIVDRMQGGDNLLKENPNGLIIGTSLNLTYDNVCYLIIEGFNQSFKTLNPNYLIKWKMINDYKNKNIKYINLNAVSGDFTNINKYSGLNEMKLGFNSLVTEYIGEFELIISPLPYNLYKNLNKEKKK